MWGAEIQIHWGEGGGPDVDLRTRDIQGPWCCSSAVQGKTPGVSQLVSGHT